MLNLGGVNHLESIDSMGFFVRRWICPTRGVLHLPLLETMKRDPRVLKVCVKSGVRGDGLKVDKFGLKVDKFGLKVDKFAYFPCRGRSENELNTTETLEGQKEFTNVSQGDSFSEYFFFKTNWYE